MHNLQLIIDCVSSVDCEANAGSIGNFGKGIDERLLIRWRQMGRQSTGINLDDEKSSAAPGTRRYADDQTFRKIIMLSYWLGEMLSK